jgi:hypothetical protein
MFIFCAAIIWEVVIIYQTFWDNTSSVDENDDD